MKNWSKSVYVFKNKLSFLEAPLATVLTKAMKKD
jgi:hypothetical protein